MNAPAFAKALPGAEAGRALLGLMLTAPEACAPGAWTLTPDQFADAAQARLYAVLERRWRRREPIDPLLVGEELLADPAVLERDGADWLTALVARRPAPELSAALVEQVLAAWGPRLLAEAPRHGAGVAAAVETWRRAWERAGEVRADRFALEPFETVEPPDEPFLVDALLPVRGIAFLCGPPGSGKSFVALDVALAIASGRPWLGRETLGGGVAYVCAEDPDGVALRMKAQRQARAPGPARLSRVRCCPDLRDEAAVRALCLKLAAEARALEAQGSGLRLTVVDTLAAAIPGADENLARDMTLVLGALQRIGEASGGLVMVVAHTGKDPSKGIRGWSGLLGNADALIMTERDRDKRALVLTKLKNEEDGLRVGFALRRVEVGRNRRGKLMTSCVVEYGAAEAVKAGKAAIQRMPANPDVIWRAFVRLQEREQTLPAPAVEGVRPGTPAVTAAALRAQAYDMGLFSPDGPANDADAKDRKQFNNSRNKAFNGGLGWLIRMKYLRTELGFVWSPDHRAFGPRRRTQEDAG